MKNVRACVKVYWDWTKDLSQKPLKQQTPNRKAVKPKKARAYALQQALNGTWSRFGRHFQAVVSHGLHSSSFL